MNKTKTMRKIFCLLFAPFVALADEGMWMPQLIEALNLKDMKKNGLRLTAKQIYDINKASMKDAVAIFGGGCTSEVISEKGLVLTNHHCGFSAIASLSTVEKDYLKNGYFAKNSSEELPCKGLSVTFIKRIEDVTSRVLEGTKDLSSEKTVDSLIQAHVKQIETDAKKNNHYEVFVRPFYYGNEYYLFVTEVFRDIRLVGTPPENIGKFGGETDNWMWPRHNADFSMFRIYSGTDNKPAEYNAANVPYKPLYSFPISLKGVNEGDFTMVYGFPGRTQEYLTSHAVKLIVEQQDPIRVALREKRLTIMDEDMKKNDTLRLMYTTRYASVANYHKKWRGEMLGLIKTGAIEKKKSFEAAFLKSVEADKSKSEKYRSLFAEFGSVYSEYAPLSRQYDYFTECLWGIDAFRMAASFSKVFDELKKKQSGRENKFNDFVKSNVPAIPFRNFNKETDRKLCKAMLRIYAKDIDRSLMPDILDSLIGAFKGNTDSLTDFIYNNSIFVDNTKAGPVFSDLEKNTSVAQQDLLYRVASGISLHYQKAVIPQVQYYERQINDYQKEYMAALKENVKDRKFYPDANGTMRIAYGKVEGYNGPDAVQFLYYTTLDGLVDKNSSGLEDYQVQPRLKELYEKKDFGQYADKQGKLRTAFIASNHTTGGNSGSPVLNGKGELVGTNFDRNWEGTMSDIMYNVNFCRNITLDIRFTLWIVDKYAGAGYLLKEMKIRK
jgi:hypothetical protein